MRASMLLRSAAKPHGTKLFPYEVYPLFVCMGFVGIYASYRLTKNYMQDDVRAGHQENDTARLPKH